MLHRVHKSYAKLCSNVGETEQYLLHHRLDTATFLLYILVGEIDLRTPRHSARRHSRLSCYTLSHFLYRRRAQCCWASAIGLVRGRSHLQLVLAREQTFYRNSELSLNFNYCPTIYIPSHSQIVFCLFAHDLEYQKSL